GKDRHVVWVPLHERIALLNGGAVALGNHRTDHDVVTLELAPFSVVHADRAILVEDDPTAVERLHRAQIVKPDRAIVLRLDDRLFKRLARRSADVESPHG